MVSISPYEGVRGEEAEARNRRFRLGRARAIDPPTRDRSISPYDG